MFSHLHGTEFSSKRFADIKSRQTIDYLFWGIGPIYQSTIARYRICTIR